MPSRPTCVKQVDQANRANLHGNSVLTGKQGNAVIPAAFAHQTGLPPFPRYLPVNSAYFTIPVRPVEPPKWPCNVD